MLLHDFDIRLLGPLLTCVLLFLILVSAILWPEPEEGSAISHWE